MNESTPGFVVKATTRIDQSLWISRASVEGNRTLVPRERADIFATRADAQAVIATMPRVFRGCVYIFTVQVAD